VVYCVRNGRALEEELGMNIAEIRDVLESSVRQGSDLDVPEGSRYIQLSDTLVKILCLELRMIEELP
jgi:hypothetical protein